MMKKNLASLFTLVLTVFILLSGCKKEETPQEEEEQPANEVIIEYDGQKLTYYSYSFLYVLGKVYIHTDLVGELQVEISFPKDAEEGQTYTDMSKFSVTGFDANGDIVFSTGYDASNFEFNLTRNDAENKWYRGNFQFDYDNDYSRVSYHIEGSFDVQNTH